jgi:hypothetical protein
VTQRIVEQRVVVGEEDADQVSWGGGHIRLPLRWVGRFQVERPRDAASRHVRRAGTRRTTLTTFATYRYRVNSDMS